MLYESPSVERPKRLIARWPSRSPNPHFTTARATKKATMMSTIVGLANPAYASLAVSVPVSTAAATARTDAVRIGNAPITTDRIVAAKIANRCHAWGLNVPGGGTNQIPSATASTIRRAIRPRRIEAVVTCVSPRSLGVEIRADGRAAHVDLVQDTLRTIHASRRMGDGWTG